MFGWIGRFLLAGGGIIAGWFVAKDAHNFEVISFFATLLIFTVLVAIAAFKSELIAFFKMLWKNLIVSRKA